MKLLIHGPGAENVTPAARAQWRTAKTNGRTRASNSPHAYRNCDISSADLAAQRATDRKRGRSRDRNIVLKTIKTIQNFFGFFLDFTFQIIPSMRLIYKTIVQLLYDNYRSDRIICIYDYKCDYLKIRNRITLRA